MDPMVTKYEANAEDINYLDFYVYKKNVEKIHKNHPWNILSRPTHGKNYIR